MSDIQDINFDVELLRALIWQYQDATNLRGLLEAKQDWYDENQKQFWEDWLVNVFDLRTANDFGLAVWSIILGQSLYTSFIPSVGGSYFGFGADNQNFENGNFAAQNGGNNVYSTGTARLLLRLRYFQLTGSATVPEINRIMKYLFSDYGQVFIIDNLDMTQTYMFGFALPAEMSYMLNNTDILPRPAGVKSTIVEF